jgi:MFS family permease
MTGAGAGILDREHTIAKAGFNRWLVPPAALCIHLCIGMAYGFSVFWLPLSRAIGLTASKACPDMSLMQELFTTTCDWRIASLGWMFTLFFVVLGVSAAIWGGWLDRVGPRKAGVVAALCWSGGLLIGAFGVYVHQLWIMWLGSGVIGGIGLGLGYISPVSTLVKWFPDRRGMATGMAIMGFGGGALIGSPLADRLMNYFESPTSVGVWQTFVAMAAIYFVFMMGGTFRYRLPPVGWQPEGWTPPAQTDAMITKGQVHLRDAHKTPQFWLIWLVLCLNVSAGIGIIGLASPMLQEIFGGHLFGRPDVPFVAFDDTQKALAAAVGAGFVGLFSLFNIGGRIFWASLSDLIGRKSTYYCFFVIGALLYGFAPMAASLKYLAVFAAMFCIIASMYGGGFATIPAYLADMFGTQFVGAIHGRLLTAWSTAGIVGPVVVNYMREALIADNVPRDEVYSPILWVLTAMLVAGFFCNLLIRPVAPKWFMKPEEVAALQDRQGVAGAAASGSFGIGRGGVSLGTALAWTAVGIPLAWGVWITLQKAFVLFT